MAKSQVTIAEAAFLTGKVRQTINKFTKRGDLSFSRNQEGAKVIEIAELQRLFPLVNKMEDLDKANLSEDGASAITTKVGGNGELAVLKVLLQSAERERDMIAAERERERRQAQEQIENLQNSLARAQEQGSKALLLLTNQNGEKQGDQSEQMKELAKTVELVRRQNNHLNKRLEAQANRTFWQWLMGGGGKKQSDANRAAVSKVS